MKPKVVIALNTTWNLVNFRSGLIQALISSGYEVVAIAPTDGYVEQLLALGCRFLPVKMDNKGSNPIKDFSYFLRMLYIMHRESPSLFLGYTIKPNIYGSLAARILGVPVINNISGLGFVFTNPSWLTKIVCGLYRLALSKSKIVFFQNKEDQALFISRQLVVAKKTGLLPGSGIDLNKFTPKPLPNNETIRFLLIARMLWDKGVGEYVQAAQLLKKRGIKANFYLLGFLESENPSAISRSQMDEWIEEGSIFYLGAHDKVADEIT